MNRFFVLLLSYCLVPPSCVASEYFEYSSLAQSAYRTATTLRLKEAQVLANQLRQSSPDNLIVHHIENYIDCLSVFSTEDRSAFEHLKERKNNRLDLVKQGDPSSPYFLYIQADIRLQWALLKLEFEEYFGAFIEVNKAYKLLKKNQQAFPDFVPNKKNLALLKALVGTIPDAYQWGIELLSGINGDLKGGMQEMKAVLDYAQQHNFLFEEETAIVYGFLLFHYMDQPDKAWDFLSQKLTPQKNLLHCYVMSNLAMRSQRNDKAIQLLQDRPGGPAFHPFPFLHHMLGEAKLRRLDKDADQHFQTFLKVYKGKNLIKDAYRKLAWHALIHGYPRRYLSYMESCERKGIASIGADVGAMNEASSRKVPNVQLLRARLLFDGAYYEQAKKAICTVEVELLENTELNLEYFYRLGRIQQGLKDYEQALFNYNMTIQKGRDLPYFYACNAALQSGKIYEDKGYLEKARESFELCLSMNPQEYKISLHTQAKAGLQRLN